MFTFKDMHNAPGAFASHSRKRPIDGHIESLTSSPKFRSVPHLCEYIAGSSGTSDMFGSEMRYMNGLIPKIVNEVMSYTCLTRLRVEHQETGVALDSHIQSNVYMSFCLLARKHYIAKLYDLSVTSKGVSYVRRTGSVLGNVANIAFLKILIESQDRDYIALAVSREYNALKIAVTRQKRHNLMIVRQSVMGDTHDYVNVVRKGTGVKERILASSFTTRSMSYDVQYYYDILKRCVERCVICADIPDAHAISVYNPT